MKYIIDLPDEIAEASARYWKETTDMTLAPYIEPDHKAIEDEVWKFVQELIRCNNGKQLSYQEVKAKYDAWKKEKEEIHVGDEVLYGDTNGIVVGIDTATEDSGVNVIMRDGRTGYIGMAYVTKTGRHFDEMERLLEKMKGE